MTPDDSPQDQPETPRVAGQAPQARTSGSLKEENLPDADEDEHGGGGDQSGRGGRQPPRPLGLGFLRPFSSLVIAAGIACIIIFFAVQPKTHIPPTVSNSGSGVAQNGGGSSNGSGSGSGGSSGGQTTLPAPKAAYKTAWGPTVITEQINTSFDLGPTPPPQENAIDGFEVTEEPGSNGESLTTVSGGSIVQWNGRRSPSFADCVKALQGGSASSTSAARAAWTCAQTPQGLIARLESKGVATNTPTLITYRFRVTVWNPAK